MENYFLYLIIASLTIASPGPGVVLTLTSSLKFGIIKTIPAIIGISFGMFILAVIAGSGLGLLIATNDKVYSALKILGALYLVYLSMKLLLSMNKKYQLDTETITYQPKKLFIEGFLITMANPKPIIFFIALFPQFMNKENFILLFFIYSLSFCGLILIIHTLYGSIAHIIRNQTSTNYFRYINFTGGLAYLLFAFALFYAEVFRA